MGNISLLIAAGFSANKGYPIGNQLNEGLLALTEDDFLIHSSGAFILTRKTEREERSRDEKASFFVKLIAFYASQTQFHYENFYDYINELFFRKRNDERFNAFGEEFRKAFPTATDNQQFLLWTRTILQQAVSTFLVDSNNKQYYNLGHMCKPSYPGYSGFLYCAEEWVKNNIVHAHSLNHDIFTETFNHTDWLRGKISDGFTEAGSPYYGKCRNGYMVRLRYFVNKYDTPFRLYKLHSSRE